MVLTTNHPRFWNSFLERPINEPDRVDPDRATPGITNLLKRFDSTIPPRVIVLIIHTVHNIPNVVILLTDSHF